MDFICSVCGEPLIKTDEEKYEIYDLGGGWALSRVLKLDEARYEVYELFGRWTCSRDCAIKQEYALGTIKKGANVGSKCTKCGKVITEDMASVTLNGNPYCDEVCMTLDLIDKGELKVQEVTEEELAKNWVRWSNYV